MTTSRYPSLSDKQFLRAGLAFLLMPQVALVEAFKPLLCPRTRLKSLNGIITQSNIDSSVLYSSLSDDGDFGLIGLNAEAPLNTFEVTNDQASAFGLQSAEDIEKKNETQKKNTILRKAESTTFKEKGGVIDELSGLTADGDFIIEGVNAIDPTANRAVEKYGSPLIDPNSGSPAEGDLFSQLSLTETPQTQQPTTTNTEIDNLTGLTEDGDIALVGFNTVQPAVSSSDQSQVDQGEILSSLMQKQQQQLMDPMTPPLQQQAQPDVSAEEVEDMTMWLQDIIPTLQDDDCIYYAERLLALGFHQDCVTKCELRLADLAFMRPLHGRYFFHEVKGIPHPPKVLENYDYDQERVVYDDES